MFFACPRGWSGIRDGQRTIIVGVAGTGKTHLLSWLTASVSTERPAVRISPAAMTSDGYAGSATVLRPRCFAWWPAQPLSLPLAACRRSRRSIDCMALPCSLAAP